jgi:hypothetical protein
MNSDSERLMFKLLLSIIGTSSFAYMVGLAIMIADLPEVFLP